ncbi:MAG TPA: hypothetical protein PKO06_18560 [Candidatus Ozemobacteraceae bacterium]|nr:hypothetical protein [Candidatus Ozemobacteraceae bacterium]
MKRISSIVLFLFLVTFSFSAGALDFPVTCTIDLEKDSIDNKNPLAIQVHDRFSDHMAVVRITLDPQKTEMRAARFEIEYGEETTGWTVNIGDSVSNNGHGGDSANQTHDSEVQILDGDLTLIGSDLAPQPPEKVVKSIKRFAQPKSTVKLEVSNEKLAWVTADGSQGEIRSPFIYALNGQRDSEGQSNFDIYAAFNRVVSDTSRNGRGVKRVYITLLPDKI